MIGKNNVLNIRNSNARWKGKIGSTRGFVDFDSIESCLRCGIYLLENTYARRNIVTIKDIISTWAPPCENNTKAYINYVIEPLSGIWSYSIYKNLPKFSKFIVFERMCLMETNFVLTYETFIEVYNKFNHERK